MNRESVINRTMEVIQKLPSEKIEEVSDFAEFILSKLDDDILKQGIQHLVQNGNSYNFLNQEPDLYTLNDLKVSYK